MFLSRIAILTVVLLNFLSAPTFAKKVICISDCNSTFVNNHEGYLRALGIGQNDVIQIGGNLTDCLANLVNGDELVIVAHGSGTGTGFVWQADAQTIDTFTGFGGGQGQVPVPAGFGNLMNITVEFCSCWSARDPDGAGGSDTSLTDKIIAAMGGAGNNHTATGFNDKAWAEVCYSLSVAGGTDAEKTKRRNAAIKCLKDDTSWMNNPPANRPGTGGQGQPANQQTAAQAIVDNCPGVPQGSVTVTIPNQVGVSGIKAGYKKPVNKIGDPPAGSGSSGCSCTQLPGCGFGTQSTIIIGACCLPNGACETITLISCETPPKVGTFLGPNSTCLGDMNGDGIDDACQVVVPAVSNLGLVLLVLMTAVAGVIVICRRRSIMATK